MKFKIILITFIIIEFFSFIIINFYLGEKYIQWLNYDKPQIVNNLNWFEKNFHYHPYLAYTSDELIKASRHKPAAQKEAIVIGILGGSFAQSLANFLNTLKGKSLVDLFVKKNNIHKKILFLNFASGGYIQPQQLITSVLYSKKADFFISIEGFNELSSVSNGPSCMPPEWNKFSVRYDPLYRNFWMKSATLVKKTYLYISRFSQYTNTTTLLSFLSQNVTSKFIYALYEKGIKHNNNCKKDEIKLSKYTKKIDRWINNIKKHHKIMNGIDKKLITVMQPNQYDPHSKNMTTEEKKLFLNYRNLQNEISDIYPLAGERFLEVKKTFSLSLLDFRKVFVFEKEKIYVDGCCHVNGRGNQILATKLLSELHKLIKWKKIK